MTEEKTARLDFDEVCDLLVTLGSKQSASEVHGLLAGELAAGKRMDYSDWLNAAKEHLDVSQNFNKEQSEKLQYIYMATLTALADEQLGFYPLLADDDSEVEIRLSCLADWCQGFLAGFALVEKQVAELSEVVNDALNDLAAISQVGTNEDDEWNESAEEDYFQIVEYVRLAAMNIFVEYAVDAVDNSDNNAPDAYLNTQNLFTSRKLH
jgi:yecA family protein